ncbi:hypothetical protein [Streptomyces yangpuensis]
MLLVDHDHVHRRVVDLDLLQQIDHGRRHTPGWLQPAGRLAPLPRPPLERPGSRSETTPTPARHRPTSTYT